MHSPSTKIALLFITAMSTHMSLSPPNPPAQSEEQAGKKNFFERWVLWFTWTTKTFTWIFTVLDVSMLLICFNVNSGEPDSINCIIPYLAQRSNFVCSRSDMTAMLFVSPVLVFGTALALASACLRSYCFHTLGRMFTFEVTIKRDHALITTGPYSIVRHPSYVGLLGTFAGASLVLMSRGSFLREHFPETLVFYSFGNIKNGLRLDMAFPSLPHLFNSVSSSVRQAFAGAVTSTLYHSGWHTLFNFFIVCCVSLWFIKVFIAVANVYQRTYTEDDELRKKFGKGWEEYAKLVRWRLVPGII